MSSFMCYRKLKKSKNPYHCFFEKYNKEKMDLLGRDDRIQFDGRCEGDEGTKTEVKRQCLNIKDAVAASNQSAKHCGKDTQ